MTPERWRILQELFERALECSAEQRNELIAEVRARDAEAADELGGLLEAHERSTLPIDRPFVNPLSAAPPHLFSAGQVILGRFEIISFLGCGGMGEVYEANDREMGRIALKTVRRDISSDERALSRLRREVQIARQIASPYVCRVYEFFPIAAHDEYPELACFTMELLNGQTLSSLIREAGPLAWAQVKELTLNICEGLHAIHAAGVIHRDLKSSNIMVLERDRRLQAVVMDFGLVRKPLAISVAASGMTASGRIVGTPQYMAPEQFQGEEVSPATDLYAMGIVIYEMISGKNPFDAAFPLAAAAQRARHVEPARSPHGDVPQFVNEVIARCLQYDPLHRYKSARELAEALSGPRLHATELPRWVSSLVTQRPWAAALVCILLAAIVAAFTLFPSKTNAPPADALHWYNKGIAALDEGSYLSAATAFQKAIEHDQGFALAHARLADAWFELDFTGRAEHEMLLATIPDAGRRVSKIERDYLKAIRAYVTGDFQSAVREYKWIAGELPANERATGYLDLARAQEKAGAIPAAIESYSQAVQLPPESPAPLVRRAILEQREGKLQAADADFSKADALYKAAQNYEGQAEINYQRGYLASTSGHLLAARQLLDKSLQTAKEISSVPLEIRALTRLAVVAYGGGNNDDAISLANQAIEIAHNNGVDYWAIDARARLGNVYRDRGQPGDLESADTQLRQALQLAQQNGSPRLVALARWSLAGLSDQQGRAEDTLAYASDALDYYRKQHFANESSNCVLLIGRAKLEKCQFSDALHGGLEALDLARKLDNPAAIYPAEELVGSAYLKLEQYPDALKHFQASIAASSLAGQQVEYQLVHCADVLGRLGRYSEAEKMLASIPDATARLPVIAYQRNCILASMSLNRCNYAKSVNFSRIALQVAKAVPAEQLLTAELLGAQAYAKLGSQSAQLLLEQGASTVQKAVDPDASASFQYTASLVYLAAGRLADAQSAATSALPFFLSSEQKESEWQTRLVLATLASRSGDRNASRDQADKALDILSSFEHNWGSRIYKNYAGRPDVQIDRRQLLALARR